jgi:predicted AlkP superfamily pyrophosphatase or phosphodiesterase
MHCRSFLTFLCVAAATAPISHARAESSKDEAIAAEAHRRHDALIAEGYHLTQGWTLPAQPEKTTIRFDLLVPPPEVKHTFNFWAEARDGELSCRTSLNSSRKLSKDLSGDHRDAGKLCLLSSRQRAVVWPGMRRSGMVLWLVLEWFACSVAACATAPSPTTGQAAAKKIVVIILDGLRPDSINASDTPNLYRLREAGTDFTDHHATYPTFTMMNAASFATGGFPDTTGYYGNVLWEPGARGNDSANKEVDFRQPVFSEDYAILDDLNRHLQGNLFLSDELSGAAHRAKMRTAIVGKGGAAYALDYRRGDLIFDEKGVFPLSFAKELQAAGFALPPSAPNAYPPSELVLKSDNGNPLQGKPLKRLKDGVTSDPTDSGGSPYSATVRHQVNVFVNYVLPKAKPHLSMIWLRDPDTTQHNYGVGSVNYRDALRSSDQMVGLIMAKLDEPNGVAATDIIVVSDHGHSNVTGALTLFPLRTVENGEVGAIDPNGYSVSGQVRLADLFRRAGFVAFDGLGCSYLPVGSGIKATGAPVYKTLIDADGTVCGKAGQKYLSPSLKVPDRLPPNSLVVAVNGGSDYIYVPDRDRELVVKAIRFLQSRSEIGAIFVDARYGSIPGTLPLQTIHAQNPAQRNPDIIAGYDYDEDAVVNGVKGTEYAGILLNSSYRGTHGSFSPIDVHNTLIAYGPHFREQFKDPLPTGNVDLAPTLARILGLPLPRADGRPLVEALRDGPTPSRYFVDSSVVHPDKPATGLTIRLPTDPDGADIDRDKSTYNFEIHTKTLVYDGKVYVYFDWAKAIRR